MTTTHTAREHLLAILPTLPLRKADAIVLLSGDGDRRLPTAAELFRQQAAPLLVCTGGVNNPPFSIPGDDLALELVTRGVHPTRLKAIGQQAMHTRAEAEAVVAYAMERELKTLLVVTSGFHLARAFLTFVKAISDANADLLVLPVPAGDLTWFAPVDGDGPSRADRLDVEAEKIAAYQATGDVASYVDGLAYLKKWEGTGPTERAA